MRVYEILNSDDEKKGWYIHEDGTTEIVIDGETKFVPYAGGSYTPYAFPICVKAALGATGYIKGKAVPLTDKYGPLGDYLAKAPTAESMKKYGVVL